MKTLSPNWFTEGTLDFEYKQYILLAYLSAVQQYYRESKLYPVLADVIFHTRNLEQYRQLKEQLAGQFPATLTGLDAEQLTLRYTPQLTDDAVLQEIDQIVDFALPELHRHAQEGRGMYDVIDNGLTLEPVGLLPLYRLEGYLLLRINGLREVQVYRYTVAMLSSAGVGSTVSALGSRAASAAKPQRLQGIHTAWVSSFTWSLAQTYQSMKLSLIQQYAELPNPATFAVESALQAPVMESVLPIAKRRLLVAVNSES